MAGKNRCRSLGFSLCENCQWLFNPTDGSDAKVDPRSDRSYYRKLPCDNAGKGQSTGGARASEGAQRAAAAQSELAGLDPRGPAPHPSAAAVPLPVPRSRRRGADTGHAAPPAAVPRKRKQAVAFAPTDTPRANGWRLDLSMASELQQQIKSARAAVSPPPFPHVVHPLCMHAYFASLQSAAARLTSCTGEATLTLAPDL